MMRRQGAQRYRGRYVRGLSDLFIGVYHGSQRVIIIYRGTSMTIILYLFMIEGVFVYGYFSVALTIEVRGDLVTRFAMTRGSTMTISMIIGVGIRIRAYVISYSFKVTPLYGRYNVQVFHIRRVARAAPSFYHYGFVIVVLGG